MAIPADRNVVQMEAEKKLKCNSLCIEMQRMWNLKCTVVSAIIGVTGTVNILFHNSNVFGSCVIHVLCTGCAKIKKNFRRQKVD